MSTTKIVSLDEAKQLFRGRPGLVLGQPLSIRITRETLAAELSAIAIDCATMDEFKQRLELGPLPDALDELATSSPAEFDRFRARAEQYLQSLQPSHAIPKLSRIGWSAVISLCLDSSFDESMRSRYATAPTSRRTVVLTAPAVLSRPLVLPIYKVLGNCRDSAEPGLVALSKSEQLLKKQEWKELLASMRDFVRDDALVFLGTDDELALVQDLLSALLATNPPYPGKLLFLESDPCGLDPVIERLARFKTTLWRVNSDVDSLLSALDTATLAQLPLDLTGGARPARAVDRFAEFRSIIDIVPDQKPTYTFQSRRQEVLDALFRPLSTRWDPFLFNVDLPRNISDYLLKTITQTTGAPHPGFSFVLLRGEAGVGKTVVAKRLAVDLSKGGHIALWCKRAPPEFMSTYRQLARAIREFTKENAGQQVFLFCDDPYVLGVSPLDLAALLESEGADVTLVTIIRNSDKALQQSGLRLPYLSRSEFEVGWELEPEEEEALPEFLVRAGSAATAKDAAYIVGAQSGKNAKDILCRLWYLLPDTREQLERSLGDEYFRLENVDKLIRDVADSAEAQNAIARRAYEAVAVSSGLGVGVPTEVLVSALRINYDDWISLCANGRPLWGLLYPVEHEETGEVYYFTRNEVVTDVLLRHINSGIGHSGELRVLRELIGACNGSGAAYRDFLLDLLAKRKDALGKIVSAREGRELFELAMRTFPIPDRTLIHHFGKWVTDVEHKHGEAYEIFQRALETPDYPYAAHEERSEFVHTSMAAAIVRRVKAGEQDRESGLLAIKRHLREASNPSFFNLYTVHVQVNSLLKLQQGQDPISMDCLLEAHRAIEKAQQLAGSRGRERIRFHDALGFLENQKRELADALAPFETLKDESINRYEATGDQLVLEVAAMKGLLEASIANKGSDYNDLNSFLRRCQERIIKKKQRMSLGLRQTRIDLIVRWRMQDKPGEIDWNAFLGDISSVREDPSRRDDLLLLLYEGVAYFQLRMITEAQAAFMRLRSLSPASAINGQSRLYFRSKDGRPEQLQGQVLQSSGRQLIRLADIGYDAPIGRSGLPSGVHPGAIVHCWLAFSFMGPRVEFLQPQPTALLLPN